MTIIVAIDENNAIGKDNQLLWHLPDDLKHFKTLTQNHCVIMGRKTYESIGRPLPNRVNIVISRNKDFQLPDGVLLAGSLEEAIKLAKEKDNHPFIIGGGNLYKQALGIVNKLEITLVHTKIEEADTYFPILDFSQWEKIYEEKHFIDEKHLFDFTFLTYSKK